MAAGSLRANVCDLTSPAPTYDRIGVGYTVGRRSDPTWALAIETALGNATSIINVGAGTGSYEPPDRNVVAIEPSDVMLGQRAPTAAPAIRAVAECLPFCDRAAGAVLAVLTVHHWPD